MKYDENITFEVLKAFEEQQTDPQGKDRISVAITGVPYKKIYYHILLLRESGFLTSEKTDFQTGRLTYNGHILLDQLRRKYSGAKGRSGVH